MGNAPPCETVECLHDAERALVRVCINAMDPTHPAQFIALESQLEYDC